MSGPSHRSLRLGALALLVALAIWPRTKTTSRTAELAQARATTHGVAARAETVSAKLVSPPRTAKLTVTDVDESALKY